MRLLRLAEPATLVVEEIVAKVNGDVILRSDYEQTLAELHAEIQRDQRIPPERSRPRSMSAQKGILCAT